ncbi:hypothetical protein THAOC_32646 [Thalassiosira oceanica]|uniref:Uncharacterized protein n=1 Tax=Thalassiosira oceanica TaxID=159749 RepID=K0RHZ0_THAOC|nr:hypothetical protein THAOC_32646 [Thalassiosira oceanica]|eukprot:EJK48546.1 hypothetical protein THAOC_32646 [Thalassiosira oceanica]
MLTWQESWECWRMPTTLRNSIPSRCFTVSVGGNDHSAGSQRSMSSNGYSRFQLADLGFFELLRPLSNFWHVVVLIIVTALAASSVDTLQNGIASVFSSDLLGFGLSDRTCTWITRVLLLAINVPAVIMSSKRFDVIGLFLAADIVCATAVLPVFLGLILEDVHFLIPAPTELGAFLGIISGICTVLVNGVINGHDEAVNGITGEVIATGPFSYFWLTNGAQCALCGAKTMVSFIVTPLFAGFFTLLFSRIDILVRGERAREPLIKHALFYKPNDTAGHYNLAENKGEVVEGSVEEVDAEEAGLSEKDAEAGESIPEEAPAKEEIVA